MKKGAVLLLAVVFSACLIHFYYAEDHCPVHCPMKGGGFGHVHPHHAGSAACQCFLASLSAPETCDLPAIGGPLTALDGPAAEHILGRPASAVTPPPRSSLV